MTIPAVIAHGGAGPGPDRQENLEVAVRKAAEILSAGGSALDAAVQACVILEDDPVFNAGTGSVMRTDPPTTHFSAYFLVVNFHRSL